MEDQAYKYMDWPGIEAIAYGEEGSPRDVMAPRLVAEGLLVQGFFPDASEAEAVVGKKAYPMKKEDEAGYFACVVPGFYLGKKLPQYHFHVTFPDREEVFEDVYQYPGLLTEDEERAFCAGVFYDAYKKLGSLVLDYAGTKGTYFAVWAPNARRVSVVGSFNKWDGRRLIMHRSPMSGIFELFVPGLGSGEPYLYEILTKSEGIFLKADPYGQVSRLDEEDGRISYTSVTSAEDDFDWEDEEWLCDRSRFARRDQAVSIMEVKLQEWQSAEEVAAAAQKAGYTHVELLPVMEYLDSDSDGYSTAGYFSVTDRVGGAAMVKKLVNDLHKRGIGVILDWTPAQFPRFHRGLERFDGTPLYERPDLSQAIHPFWGTMLFNYDSPMVKDFLISNACFWLDEFHMDGFRMDDVDAMLYLDYGRQNGSWSPNIYGSNENLYAVEFLKHLNSLIKRRHPGALLIAQEDGLWPELTDSVENDHIGFDYKWSGGWTKDFLSYMALDPFLRVGSHDQLTLSMLYAYCEHYVLTLGRRDIGSLDAFLPHFPGSEEQKHSQLREVLAYMYLHPGCKMTAAAPGLADAPYVSFLADLNKMYREHPALHQLDGSADGFEWIQLTKSRENVLAFLRKSDEPKEELLVLANFSGVDYENYEVGVPGPGKYTEIFNTDNALYGGVGYVNPKPAAARKEECDERPYQILVRLPALSVAVFACPLGKKQS